MEIQSPLFESGFDLKMRNKILRSRNEQVAYDQEIEYFVNTFDKKNAYLFIRSVGDGEGVYFILTLWKRNGKSDLIGLVRTDWAMSIDDSQAAFFEKENGKWKEVTTKVFPKI